MSSAFATVFDFAILVLGMDGNLDGTVGRGARQERKRLSFVHNSVVVLEGPCAIKLPATEFSFEMGAMVVGGQKMDRPHSMPLPPLHIARVVADCDRAFLERVELEGHRLDA